MTEHDHLKPWPRDPRYYVCRCGAVHSTRGLEDGAMKIMGGSKGSDGYLRVTLDGRPQRVHALVQETFEGERPPEQVTRHLNNEKLDNRSTNLQYGTRSANAQDSAKISPETVERMRILFAEGLANKAELARMFSVSVTSVRNILAGRTWADLPGPIIGREEGGE